MTTIEKHLRTRTFVTVFIIVLFISIGFLLVYEPSIDNEGESREVRRSCLGNPLFLPYGFIGLPLVLVLGVIDVLRLIILKKYSIQKMLINFLLMVFSFLLLLLLPF